MKQPLSKLVFAGIFAGLLGCSTIPEGTKAIDNFEKEKYLGKWYEIARFDFSFEKDLNNTTAEYFLLENRKLIGVRNRGFNYKTRQWEEAVGKAKFRGSETVGELKVSFFGPFYGAYNIIALDKDYQYALIAGKNTDYLWILSRTTGIPEEIKKEYLEIAGSAGFRTERLIWVEHDN